MGASGANGLNINSSFHLRQAELLWPLSFLSLFNLSNEAVTPQSNFIKQGKERKIIQ